METINQRINQIIEHLHMNVSEFAQFIGEGRQNVANIISGRQPRHEVLQKIKNATGINLNWLLTGEGDMFPPNEIDKLLLMDEPEAYLLSARMKGPLADQDIVELPMLDAQAMGSFKDNIYGDMYKLETGKTYKVLKQPRHNYTKAMVMEIVGDSMFPISAME